MNHSPSGRIGPAGPERGQVHGWELRLLAAQETLPGRYRARPSSRREGVATLFKQTTQKLHDL
jgi:hypothetical protein